MKPTTILSDEHRVIEVVLACLEQIAVQAERAGRLDRQSAEEALDFVRNFADRCHHGKEEDHLFVVLESRGLGRQSGPIGQMLYEHEQGRVFVRGMAGAVDGASKGEAEPLTEFVRNARGYVALLRAHIQKEDGILFPMADRLFSDADQSEMLATFEKVESEHMGAGTHDKYLRLAQTLADRFGVSRETITGASHCCGH